MGASDSFFFCCCFLSDLEWSRERLVEAERREALAWTLREAIISSFRLMFSSLLRSYSVAIETSKNVCVLREGKFVLLHTNTDDLNGEGTTTICLKIGLESMYSTMEKVQSKLPSWSSVIINSGE
ncbi:hypothetical protein F2Q68_00019785 [Brassica cretica]|uniref:Uncharacterized protein n=1 Tax=Brassica cretica TaxID=69181 RepID=A0A8S9G393_BRACR|nr:hypothetical protein F2Q68_00019785 [Brassica cretica]